jgi:hypothetical protein
MDGDAVSKIGLAAGDQMPLIVPGGSNGRYDPSGHRISFRASRRRHKGLPPEESQRCGDRDVPRSPVCGWRTIPSGGTPASVAADRPLLRCDEIERW